MPIQCLFTPVELFGLDPIEFAITSAMEKRVTNFKIMEPTYAIQA
jgi:hypothetical protein